MKEKYISLFARLGDELEGFGNEGVSRAVLKAASLANPWFSTEDMVFAVRSLRENMLREGILREWLGGYEIDYARRRKIAVIMAGNIPLAGFFDMICVLACGCECHMKPSSKDSVLIAHIVGILRRLDPEIPVFNYAEGGAYDAAIATGSDNTNRYFRSMFAGVPALLRGSRASAAVLDGSETAGQLRGLSEDIFRYNGMGCRSVSLVFVPEGYDMASFAEAVKPATGGVNPKYIGNYRQERAVAAMQGKTFTDGGCFLLSEERGFPNAVSRLNYTYYKDMAEASDWLARHEGEIQTVVAGDGSLFPRTSGFGLAQHPGPLDYADGRDVAGFLISLK